MLWKYDHGIRKNGQRNSLFPTSRTQPRFLCRRMERTGLISRSSNRNSLHSASASTASTRLTLLSGNRGSRRLWDLNSPYAGVAARRKKSSLSPFPPFLFIAFMGTSLEAWFRYSHTATLRRRRNLADLGARTKGRAFLRLGLYRSD